MSQQNDPWSRGLELYQKRDYWEAHEAWEELWQASDKASPEGLVLRGLIQAAAACLKSLQGNRRGLAILRERAANTLAASGLPRYRELDIQKLIHGLRHLQPGEVVSLAGLQRKLPNV